MRIAQIAPLIESVPPKFYGGTERVVSYLTEALVHQGHEVTLFASGDSQTEARLVPCVPRALRLDETVCDVMPHQMLQLERVRRQADDFDILHFHIDCLQYPLFRHSGHTIVTTLHGRQDLPDLRPFYKEFDDVPLVSISYAQRRPLPGVNWAGNVYHGLPASVCPYNEHPRGDYFAFIGRISPEKRVDRAIEIAQRTGMKLKIAAKIDKADEDYYREYIAPLMHGDLIEFVGEIGEGDKAEFLGNAKAVLFPIDWPEPFGLVMIEAMSCGTPVIAWDCGSVAEVIDPGITGYAVDSVDEAVAAVASLDQLDRRQVRKCFERRFTAEHMARDYVQVYQKLIAGSEASVKLPTVRIA